MTQAEQPSRRDRTWYWGFRSTLPYILRFSASWIVVSVAAVLAAGGASFLLMSENVPEAQQGRLLTTLLLQTTAVLVAVLILAFSTTHRLVEPYLAIQRAFKDVQGGDLQRRISFRSRDGHLKELEGSFNEMMEALEDGARGDTPGPST